MRSAAALLGIFLLAGCGDGGVATTIPTPEMDPDPVDLSGNWRFEASVEDPIRTVECSGELADELFSFCNFFLVVLLQEEEEAEFRSAPPEESFCDSAISMSGSATVDDVSGILVIEESVDGSPPTVRRTEIEFTGVTVADSATFAMVELTIDGLEGECLMGGSYLGLRVEPPEDTARAPTAPRRSR